MHKTMGVVLVCSSLFTTGCLQPENATEFEPAFEVSRSETDWRTQESSSEPTNIASKDLLDGFMGGSLQGVMGPVAVDTKKVYFTLWNDASFTEINTVAPQADGGAAMSILLIQGDLSQFKVGDSFIFNWDNNSNDDEIWIDAIGCSGPTDGEWNYFDEPADEVIVSVEEGPEPGTRALNYYAHFANSTSPLESELQGAVVFEAQ